MKLLRILLWPLGFDWVDEEKISVTSTQITENDFQSMYETYMQLKEKGISFETAWRGIAQNRGWSEKESNEILDRFLEFMKKQSQSNEQNNSEGNPVIL